MSTPKNPRQIRTDLFTARAIHDPEFRRVMVEFGISPEGTTEDIRNRFDALDGREFSHFTVEVQKDDLLNPAADRNGGVLYALNDLSSDLWLRAKIDLSVEADRIMEGPVAEARKELRRGNLEKFHEEFAEVKLQVAEFATAIREARHRIGDELRNFLFNAPTDMTREQRKEMIEKKTLEHSVSPKMLAVLSLENTLAQEEVDFVMKKKQNEPERTAGPSASLTP